MKEMLSGIGPKPPRSLQASRRHELKLQFQLSEPRVRPGKENLEKFWFQLSPAIQRGSPKQINAMGGKP
jgi:hypothetical protein